MAQVTPPPYLANNVWYFAYGSNMSSEKFTGSLGIVPLATARARVPGWRLAFNIPGLPYSEPAFTSIIPQGSQQKTQSIATHTYPDVIGRLFLITQAQYVRVLAAEGGGTAYSDIQVDALPLGREDFEVIGLKISVRTLGAAIQRNPWPKPSIRYMNIVLAGSREGNLPQAYQFFLESVLTYVPPSSRRGRIGSAVFLAFWVPVMGLLEKVTNAAIGDDGLAPTQVVWLVRCTMMIIWATHDVIFAPICGRGDGYSKNYNCKL